jgi:TRAP-type C4-dicarboxylate transport system permease small subunit
MMIHRIVKRLLESLMVSAIALIVITTTSQVISRYIVGSAIIWTEELARYLGVWTVMLSSGLVLYEGMHVGLDLLLERASPRLKLTATMASLIAVLVFSSVLIIVGWTLVLSVSQTRSPALRIPMSWVYASVPVGGVLLVYFDILMIIETLRKRGTV